VLRAGRAGKKSGHASLWPPAQNTLRAVLNKGSALLKRPPAFGDARKFGGRRMPLGSAGIDHLLGA